MKNCSIYISITFNYLQPSEAKEFRKEIECDINCILRNQVIFISTIYSYKTKQIFTNLIVLICIILVIFD